MRQIAGGDSGVVLGHQIVVVFANLNLIDLDAGVLFFKSGDFSAEIITGTNPEIQGDCLICKRSAAKAQQHAKRQNEGQILFHNFPPFGLFNPAMRIRAARRVIAQ